MQEKLEKLRQNKFLEISSWAGLSPTPGSQGIIITKDKKIYYYHKYYRISENFKDKVKPEDISGGIVIDEDIYLKLVIMTKWSKRSTPENAAFRRAKNATAQMATILQQSG